METAYEETDLDLRIILQSRSCPCKGATWDILRYPLVANLPPPGVCRGDSSTKWEMGQVTPEAAPVFLYGLNENGWKWALSCCLLTSFVSSTILTCIFFFIRKRWHLFPPEDTPFLYPTRIPYEESSVFSKINVVNPDLKRFPQFRKARRHMVTLSPGQVMGDLKHWWPVSGHPSYNFFQVLCHVPPCRYRWLTVAPSLLLRYWKLASPAVGVTVTASQVMEGKWEEGA